MIIQGKRVNNVLPYISHISDGSKLIIGIVQTSRFLSQLRNIGFTEPFEAGKSILPDGVGPVSRFNADGKEIKHEDRPMETLSRQAVWHWTEWHGPHRIEKSRIVDIPYSRYPRSFIKPPAIELTFTKSSDGELILISPLLVKSDQSAEAIKHLINLYLEIFGECQLFTGDLDALISIPVRRLNWTILPQGELPWEQVRTQFDPLIKKARRGNWALLYYRLETVNSLKPDFRAFGNGGFKGYIIHGFLKKGIYVLESLYYGNATYIFGDSWVKLSKMTKAEILNESLQKGRIIHQSGWKIKLEGVVNT